MEYIYYKHKSGNFGDDLNGWLWPNIFGEESLDNKILLGAGTMLGENVDFISKLNKDKQKIVFGSGVRHSANPFNIDKTWTIEFLRGPISAAEFNNQYDYITDAAYCLRFTDDFSKFENMKKKYEISLMPHIATNEMFDWKGICNILGFNYISPHSPNGIEHTLSEIASSKYIITEAMHGAIVADIFRIPWHRFVLGTQYYEGAAVSELKWLDWLHSVGIYRTHTTKINFYSEHSFSNYFSRILDDFIRFQFLRKHKIIDDIKIRLSNISRFYLSDEKIIQEIDIKLSEKIKKIQNTNYIDSIR